MNLSKIKALAVVLTMAAAASAQFNSFENARTTALGGAPLSDISRVYDYPVLMMGYLNHAQVTWNGAGAASGGTDFGSFIFTKSINDMMAIGVYYNSVGFLSPVSPLNTPHLLLGFDLGILQLGADIFIQHNSETENSETAATSTTIEGVERDMNFGARIAAEIEFGDIGLLAKVGIGFPSELNQRTTINPAGTTISPDEEYTGVYLEAGAEVSYPFGDIDLTAGVGYTTVNEQRSGETGGVPYSDVRNSVLSLYLSGEVNIVETAAAVFAYEYRRGTRTTTAYRNTATPPAVTIEDTKTMVGGTAHIFYAGAENSWDDVWKFDNLQLRTGLRYQIVDAITNRTNSDNNDYSKTSDFADRDFIKPIVGLGLSKGPVTLDMALSFGRMFDNDPASYTEWRGLMAGPTIATASATVKF